MSRGFVSDRCGVFDRWLEVVGERRGEDERQEALGEDSRRTS